MKIFKELKKLGYKHYTEHTVEELDNLPLESKERIMEQALVLRWFREKYGLYSWITMELGNKSTFCWVLSGEHTSTQYAAYFHTYEEAELACLSKLIEIVKQNHEKNSNT
jgi:hypothetical protein